MKKTLYAFLFLAICFVACNNDSDTSVKPPDGDSTGQPTQPRPSSADTVVVTPSH